VIRPWLVPRIEERRGDAAHPSVLAGQTGNRGRRNPSIEQRRGNTSPGPH